MLETLLPKNAQKREYIIVKRENIIVHRVTYADSRPVCVHVCVCVCRRYHVYKLSYVSNYAKMLSLKTGVKNCISKRAYLIPWLIICYGFAF